MPDLVFFKDVLAAGWRLDGRQVCGQNNRKLTAWDGAPSAGGSRGRRTPSGVFHWKTLGHDDGRYWGAESTNGYRMMKVDWKIMGWDFFFSLFGLLFGARTGFDYRFSPDTEVNQEHTRKEFESPNCCALHLGLLGEAFSHLYVTCGTVSAQIPFPPERLWNCLFPQWSVFCCLCSLIWLFVFTFMPIGLRFYKQRFEEKGLPPTQPKWFLSLCQMW